MRFRFPALSLRAMRKRRGLALKKLKDAAGFTLTEVLATVIILGLVSGGVAMAVGVGTRQFSHSMASSESQLLFSSLKQDLKNDLSYTTGVFSSEDSGSLRSITGYQSLRHADKREYLYLKALDSEGNIVQATDGSTTGAGQLALCSADGKVKNRLLGKGSYNYGLVACIKELRYDTDSKLYTVTMTVEDGSGGDLVNETFSIKALNKVAFADSSL